MFQVFMNNVKSVNNRWFQLGLLIRVALLFSFGSHYLHDLFIPFLDKSILQIGTNPWVLSSPDSFPYGSFLYLVLFIPKYLMYQVFGDLALGSTALSLFLVKVVLLFFDFLLFLSIQNLAKPDNSRVVFLYWLNPIVIYISYIHGQLDVVSMSLTVLSLLFLIRNYVVVSAIFFACALLSKFHVLLLLPFILVYFWNTEFAAAAFKKITSWLLIVVGISVVGFLPLLFANHLGYVSMGSPEASRIFAVKLIFEDNRELFIGVFLVLVILGRLCLATKITENGLIYGSGILMGTLLLATSPMPGWYFWVIPFLALYFAQYRGVTSILYYLLSVVYFLYFVILPYFTDNQTINNIAFTLLQTVLLSCLVFIFIAVIQFHAQLKNRLKPILIGLSGDSGAGKNHLAELVKKVFSPENLLIVEGDDYHKWERGDENWQTFTHLNPHANHLMAMKDHAEKMSRGLSISHRHYDHSTGRFTDPRLLSPTKAILFQGLHSLYMRGMRSSLDLRVFLAPTESVRVAWKILRDVNERGHSLEKVLASIEKRKTDSSIHIEPQKLKSDWLIEYDTLTEIDPLKIKVKEDIKICLRYILYNDEPITEIIELLKMAGCEITVEFLPEDMDRLSLKIVGEPTVEQIEEIAQRTLSSMRHITRSWISPKFCAGYDGINQLFLLCLLKNRQARNVNL